MASVNTKAKQINGRDREASLLGPFFKSANCIPLEAFRRPLKANILEQGFSSVFLFLLMNISGMDNEVSALLARLLSRHSRASWFVLSCGIQCQSWPWRRPACSSSRTMQGRNKKGFGITLFEIFIFCPKIQLWFPREKLSDFFGWKLVKILLFWIFYLFTTLISL